MTDTDPLASAVEHARWFAALSGPFNPKDAVAVSIREAGVSDPDAAIEIASQLSLVCDTHAGRDEPQWLMRNTERRWDIKKLKDDNRIDAVLDWRRVQSPFDGAAQDLVAALAGTGNFAPNALEAALGPGEEESRRQEFEQFICTLEWAGQTAPGYAYVDRLRAAINRLDDRRRSKTLLEHGFHGRDEQRAVLRNWLAAPMGQSPVRTLFVTGLPGIGKSALLEIAIREISADAKAPVVVRLDFDRPTLDVQDQLGLSLETARQIAAQLPSEAGTMQALRIKASAAAEDNLKGRGRDSIPTDLVRAAGSALASAGRTIIMVLDTCEILRGRGDTHPRRLFDWLDALLSLGLKPMAVIAAGRGDAFDSVPARIGQQLHLTELADEAADRFFDQAAVPSEVRGGVQALAKGNPLLLTLATAAAQVAPGHEPALKPRGRRGSTHLIAAHLYRFLLSRIPDPDLRQLADPGLVIRRINFEVIQKVLGPTLRVRPIGEKRAKHLVEELEKQNWLIARDSTAEGWLRQRSTMRAQLLPLLYAHKPALCAKIDRAAADWFGTRSERWLAVESLYHRLQLTRRGEHAPKIDRDLAQQFDDATLAELPQRAQDAVLRARGQRSTVARAGDKETAKPKVVDPGAVKDLQITIARGDWLEAADLYARAIEPARVDPASDLGDTVRTLLWRTGRWRQAKKLLRDRDAVRRDDKDIQELRPDDALARLEMRAEFAFKDLSKRLTTDRKWGDVVQGIMSRGVKTEMSAGALGMALRVAEIQVSASWRQVDPVGATWNLWGVGSSDLALRTAVSLAQKRMARRSPRLLKPQRGLSLSAKERDKAVAARRLAVHSPYAGCLGMLVPPDQSQWLAWHARRVLTALSHVNLWWNSGFFGLKVGQSGPPQESIEILTDAGLGTEWVGAAAFVSRNRDLLLVAKAAETWRRTTAGQWSYGARPPNWIGPNFSRGLDATLWVRVQELLSADNPVGTSRALLAAWEGTGAGDPPSKTVRIRLKVLLTRARLAAARHTKHNDRALKAAGALMRADAPTGFVPALATLAAFKGTL